jgi:hypothetical protein
VADTIQQSRGSVPMVLIGCKHPNGVVLNLDHYEIQTKETNRIRRVIGKSTVTLKGWAHAYNRPDPAEGLGGYVLTPVPQDFWDEWLATHGDFPMLEDKTILGPHKDATGQARDHADVPAMHAQATGELKAAELRKD